MCSADDGGCEKPKKIALSKHIFDTSTKFNSFETYSSLSHFRSHFMASSTLDPGLTKYVDAVNALGGVRAKGLCDLALSFLLTPSKSNFQVSIAEFAQQNK